MNVAVVVAVGILLVAFGVLVYAVRRHFADPAIDKAKAELVHARTVAKADLARAQAVAKATHDQAVQTAKTVYESATSAVKSFSA